MPATDDQIRDVCALLHSRGREVTPDDVWEWASKIQDRLWLSKGLIVDQSAICDSVLKGEKTMTMCLHIHFGDAL